MSELAASIALARTDFANALRRRGFEPVGASELAGRVATGLREYDVRVQLLLDFPFGPPKVLPPDDFQGSWHLQQWTGMCLYHGDDLSGLPWLDVDDFLTLIARWFTESETGWQGDLPFLDLEAYLEDAEDEQRLVLYADLDGLTWVKFIERDRWIMVAGRGSRPARRTKPKFNRKLFGYVVSIDEPQKPIADWETLASLLGEQRGEVQRAIQEYRVDVLLVRYTRDGNEGVLALKVSCDENGTISIRSLESASIVEKDLTLRAGTSAAELRHRKVAVVGAGAVGSYVADSLARSGVGTLGVMDTDIVKPGNLIRHLAGAGHIGWDKTDAVKQIIEGTLYNVTTVIPLRWPLRIPGHAELLLEQFDLVVDATADGTATALLHHAAEVGEKHIVSVCLKEDGKVVRVDILPPLSGKPLPATPESPRNPASYVFEAGCGDPVSMTPHSAVIEAASLATRHAIGLLTGAPRDPAGEVRDYR